MATLTQEGTFSVAGAPLTTETTDVLVVAASGAPTGKGRFTHPTLGVYDYEAEPDKWGGFDLDAIIEPVWQDATTLDGTSNTLWKGVLRDVQVYETWSSTAAMPATQLRMFTDMFVNTPVLPDYVIWEPNYINDKKFKVVIKAIDVAGKGFNFNHVMRQAVPYVHGPITVKMRLVEYAP